MEKENMAQDAAAAQGAEARTEAGAAGAGLGKFKSVDALLSAYNSLEAEFTRRSQRLRELEGRERAEGAAAPEPSAEEKAEDFDARVKRAVEACLSARPPYIMAEGGAGTVAPPPRVRSLEEAGRLAEDLFRRK